MSKPKARSKTRAPKRRKSVGARVRSSAKLSASLKKEIAELKRELARTKRQFQKPPDPDRSRRAKAAWQRRKIKQMVFGARLSTAGILTDHDTLRSFIDIHDDRWEQFYDFLDELGFDEQEIYDEWFSPGGE